MMSPDRQLKQSEPGLSELQQQAKDLGSSTDALNDSVQSAASYDRVKQLEMVQSVINRLAGNSFQVKNWAVGTATGAMALVATSANPWTMVIGLLPSVCFWYLDAYYTWQERLFRRLYAAIDAGSTHARYSMSTAGHEKPRDLLKAAFSVSVFIIYVMLIAIDVLVAGGLFAFVGKKGS